MPGFEQKLQDLIDEECKKSGLAAVLGHIEPEKPGLQKTLLEIYDSLVYIRRKYFLNPDVKEDGMLVLTNITPVKSEEETPLISVIGINRLEPEYYPDEAYTFHDDSGQKKLEELLYSNGVIVVNAESGKIILSKGYLFIGMVPGAIAKKRGVKFSWKELGIDEAERKRLGGPTYDGIGMRHLSALSASGIDPGLYAWVLSRESYGTMALFHDYSILFSTIESEINKEYRPIYEAAKKEAGIACRDKLAKA